MTCPEQCLGLRSEVLEREQALWRSNYPVDMDDGMPRSEETHSSLGGRGKEARRSASAGSARDAPASAAAEDGVLDSLLNGDGIVVVDDFGEMRLLAPSALHALLLDAASKSPNPALM